MSETHTPGPWGVSPDGWRVFANVTDPETFSYICATANNASTRTERNKANARLIAAAPDLLAACKMVAAMAIRWEPLSPGDIAEVNAAIAKAEGRS